MSPGRHLNGNHKESAKWVAQNRPVAGVSTVGQTKENLPELRALEECCCGPMFSKELIGIN